MTTETKFRIIAKVCACCGERKPQHEFSEDRRYRTGLQSYCKQCIRASAAKSRERRGFGAAATARHRSKWAAIAAEAAASA